MMNLGVLIKKLKKINEINKQKKLLSQTTAITPNVIIRPAVKVEEIAEQKEKEKKGKKKEEEKRGIRIPVDTKIVYPKFDEEEPEINPVNLKYPLIPNKPKKGEDVLAWAQINYNKDKNELIYYVIEPKISENTKKVLKNVEELLKETLDVDFGKLNKETAKKFLKEKIEHILDYYGFRVSEKEKKILNYCVFNDFVGFGLIEPLMNDPHIEDISCDGLNIPVYVFHRDPMISSVKTNIVFRNQKELDSFVIKLAQRCGRSISVADPLLDGALPDGSRVQATLGTDIARRGSNFTIRKFTEEPLTPIHLLNFNTLDSTMLAYLWFVIDKGKSILISGPTASGKTTLLNALSLFIRPELKIISIEDTPELRLPHPNWVPEVARAGFGFGAVRQGEVTLDDLLKESLRQRPDYIIVGEVRGSEAYVLFQQIATGHPGMSTIHASSLDKVMNRLTTKPIGLSPELVSSLDLVIFISNFRKNRKQMRKVKSVFELEEFNKKKGQPDTNLIFKWDPQTDSFQTINDSLLLATIAKERGVEEKILQSEIVRRKKVLEWMQERGIQNYTMVGKIISAYYLNPARVLELVEGSF